MISNLLYIDISIAEIYFVTSGSFINLLSDYLNILLQTAGIRVWCYRISLDPRLSSCFLSSTFMKQE
jgi:hypothetical protein